MKPSRFLLSGLLVTVALAGLTAPAQASDHLQRVSEVMLAFPAQADAQMVELRDPVSEPFPSPPYKIVAYNANGVAGTEVTLTGSGAALKNWTVMTANAQAALNVLGDQQAAALNLDTANGQVCFRRNASPIDCVNWGTINTAISGSSHTSHVPTPAAGQSVQLQCDGSYTVGTPTPAAANASCGGSGGGGGAPGGGGTPGTGTTPPVAAVAPVVHLGGKGSQKLGKSLSVVVECHAACLATAAGTVGLPGASKNFKIKADGVQIAEGKSATLKLKIPSKLQKAVKKALKKGKKVKAKLTITAKNTAGVSTAKKTIKLKK